MVDTICVSYTYTFKCSVMEKIMMKGRIENRSMPAELGLSFLMSLLQNKSLRFQELATSVCSLAKNHIGESFAHLKSLICEFFHSTDYSARAFEVSMHSFCQALYEMGMLGDLEVVPISQMQSANKKHGNVGDIELMENNAIIEAWDAKYGKPYLRDELEELRDKLILYPDVRVAGFVADSIVDMRRDIETRKNEIEIETETSICLFTFEEWVNSKSASLTSVQKEELAYRWLVALAESFAQKRPEQAPIDEPCDGWVTDLIRVLEAI